MSTPMRNMYRYTDFTIAEARAIVERSRLPSLNTPDEIYDYLSMAGESIGFTPNAHESMVLCSYGLASRRKSGPSFFNYRRRS